MVLKGTISKKKTGGKVRWFWKNDASEWVPYPAKIQKLLEDEFSDGKNLAVVKEGPWQIDFSDWKQTNTESGTVRQVKRDDPNAAIAGAGGGGGGGAAAAAAAVVSKIGHEFIWEWQSVETNAWIPYDAGVAGEIDASFIVQPDKPCFIAAGPWKIDFAKMTQTNTESSTVRPIRRRLLQDDGSNKHEQKTAAAAITTTTSPSAVAVAAAIPAVAPVAAAAAGGEVGFGNVEQGLLDAGWRNILSDEMKKSYFSDIKSYLVARATSGKTIYPPPHQVFAAFNVTPFERVKVVIIGQDPYFNPGQGHGLSFSVQKGIAIPPSLNRIFNELEQDCASFVRPSHGDLTQWAERGVLLLNATLTVEKGEPNSHAKCGWQTFTDAAIRLLSEKHPKSLVFLLWGQFAHKKAALVDESRHDVLCTPHPSPMSGSTWNGCKCFSKVNDKLKARGIEPVDWRLK